MREGQPPGDQTRESQPEAVKDNPPRAPTTQRLSSFSLKRGSEPPGEPRPASEFGRVSGSARWLPVAPSLHSWNALLRVDGRANGRADDVVGHAAGEKGGARDAWAETRFHFGTGMTSV